VTLQKPQSPALEIKESIDELLSSRTESEVNTIILQTEVGVEGGMKGFRLIDGLNHSFEYLSGSKQDLPKLPCSEPSTKHRRGSQPIS
jgi:hypothetical protein